MIYEKTCGAVVFTKTEGELKYLLVANLRGIYGFPKGHVEGDETEEETALREVYEETHVRIRLLECFRETDTYRLPGNEPTLKEVVFFLGSFRNQEIIFQKEELSGGCLANFEEALRLLHYDSAKRILTAANRHLLRLGF